MYLCAKEKPGNKFKKLVYFVLLDLKNNLDMKLGRVAPDIIYILKI